MQSHAPLIELEGLSKCFGPTRALDGLSLALKGHAPTGLLGPNGAGKSTLISLLLGLSRPSAGVARVFGWDVRSVPMAVRRRVGYLPEDDAYFAGMTGVQAACYAGELCGLRRRHALARAHDVLGYVGMSEARHREVEGYSRGMRQRLKLAQALVGDPDLLLLDEPATGLDPPGRRQMLELIEDLSRCGKAVLLSTHLLPDVERTCERVIVLERGKLLACSTVREMTSTPAGERTKLQLRVKQEPERMLAALKEAGREATLAADGLIELDVDDPSQTAFVFSIAAEHGLQVRWLEPSKRTLEAAFLDKVGP